MTKDFRTGQIQTTQIISSGSSGTNAKIVFYDISGQDTGSPNQGIIDSSKFNTSSIGSDVFLYVSGGIDQKDVGNSNSISVFGGDLHVSGNVTVEGIGKLQNIFRMSLVDYATTDSTSSNPEVVGQAILKTSEFSGSVILRAILNSQTGSGIAALKLYELTSGSFVDISGPGQQELAVTGTTPTCVESVNLWDADGFINNGDGKYELRLFTGTSGSRAFVGGAELRPQGTFTNQTISILTQSFNDTYTSGTWVDQNNKLRTTASVAISSDIQFANDIGSDVYFYVSGTFGSGSATDNISVFGGDVRISGTLAVGTGSVYIKEDSITFSSASIRNVDGKLKFYDDDNLNGKILADLTSSWERIESSGSYLFTTRSVNISPSFQQSVYKFHVSVDPIIEYIENQDFETTPTGSIPSGSWSTYGDANWFVQDTTVLSGTKAIESGDVADNESTHLVYSYTSSYDTQLSFYWKVVSEEDFDYLRWFINDVQQGEISGDSGWLYVESNSLPPGSYDIRWTYIKDSSETVPTDNGFIDNFKLSEIIPRGGISINSGTVAFGIEPNQTASAEFYINKQTEFVKDVNFTAGLSGSLYNTENGTPFHFTPDKLTASFDHSTSQIVLESRHGFTSNYDAKPRYRDYNKSLVTIGNERPINYISSSVPQVEIYGRNSNEHFVFNEWIPNDFAVTDISSNPWKFVESTSSYAGAKGYISSGELDANQVSEFVITRDIPFSSTIRFAYQVENSYATSILRFYIDDAVIWTSSGDVLTWTAVTSSIVNPGLHNFKWRYSAGFGAPVESRNAGWLGTIQIVDVEASATLDRPALSVISGSSHFQGDVFISGNLIVSGTSPGGSAAITEVTSSGSQVNIDASLGNQFKLNDLGENTEIQVPTNGSDGSWFTFSIENSGSHTVTFASGWNNIGQLDVATSSGSLSIASAVARDFGSGLEWNYAISHAETITGLTDIDASVKTLNSSSTSIIVFTTTTNNSNYLIDASVTAIDKTDGIVFEQGFRSVTLRDVSGVLDVKNTNYYSEYNPDTWGGAVVTSSGDNIVVNVFGDPTNEVDWDIKGIAKETT